MQGVCEFAINACSRGSWLLFQLTAPPLVGDKFGQIGAQMSDVLGHLNSEMPPLICLETLLEARVLLQEHGGVDDNLGKAILRSKKLSFTTSVD